MATHTLRELLDQAGYKLGVLAVGQPFSDEELVVFNDGAIQLFDQLEEDSILLIADTDAIPASWCPYLSTLLANLVSPQFGQATDLQVKHANEAVLRKLVRGAETYEEQTPDYF